MNYPCHRYRLSYIDFTDGVRYHTFDAPSDLVAQAYAETYCQELRRDYRKAYQDADLGFHITLRRRWYRLESLVDLDSLRRIFPQN